MGPGRLTLYDDFGSLGQGALSYAASLSIPLNKHLGLVLGVDGALATVDSANFNQNIAHIGFQVYLTSRLYLQASLGAGFMSEYETNSTNERHQNGGFAYGAALGYEIFQGDRSALGIEVSSYQATYRVDGIFPETGLFTEALEDWRNTGIRLRMSFF